MAATNIRLDGDLYDLLDKIAAREERTKRAVVNRALRLYANASVPGFVDSSHAVNSIDHTAFETGLEDMPQAGVAAPASDSRLAG